MLKFFIALPPFTGG